MCLLFCSLTILSSLVMLAVLLFLVQRVIYRQHTPCPKLWRYPRQPRLVSCHFRSNGTCEVEDVAFRIDFRELESNDKGRKKQNKDTVAAVTTAITAAAGTNAPYAASAVLANNDETKKPYFGFEFG